MKKRSVFLFLLACFLLLSACNGIDPTNTDTGAQTDSAEALPEENSVDLLRDGASVFDLIYPKESKFAKITAWVGQIESAMSRHAGAKLRSYDDQLPAKSDFLILLGDTRHAESTSVSEALGAGGFAVTRRGNRIVIHAADDQAMVKAVNWFCNVLLKKTVVSADGKNATLSFEENVEVGAVGAEEICINGVSLKQFTAVYPKGDESCKEIAKKLVAYCNDTLGVSLQMADDSAAKRPYELLVGVTNREESARHLAQLALLPMEFEYAVMGGRVSILAREGEGYGLAAAGKRLIDDLKNDQNHNLENGFIMKNEVKLNADPYQALAAGADVRVMTANLLSEEWGGTECKPRGEVFYANLLYYGIDVAGIQEISKQWTATLKELLDGTDYALMHEVVKGTDSNYCPMVYNTKTLELIESDAYRLAIGGPGKARTVTWGVFRHRETNKIFIVLNTHLDWIADANDYETTGVTSHYSREQQVREIAATYAELQEKYPGVDMMMTADWNTARHAHPLDLLCELTDTVFAEETIPQNDWPAYEVDHVILSDSTKLLALHCYYQNGRDLGATDHPWGFVDVQLK